MTVHIEKVRKPDEAQPGDVFECVQYGWQGVGKGPLSYVVACPGCGKLWSIRHTVEIHGDGTVSLWGPAGVGAVPRSFLCSPGCGLHANIDQGQVVP